MATKDIEGALSGVVMDASADRCGALADALGILHECGASDEECEACASRTAAAVASRMTPEGVEWPRFADGEQVRIGDEVRGKGGGAFGVTRVCFVDGGCYFSSSHNPDGTKRGRKWRYGAGERVERPEPPDTQELIYADADKSPCEYFGRRSIDCHADGGCPALDEKGGCRAAMTRLLLRRQRELCRREEGGGR